MAENSDGALLLRRIPYGDTSLICHFLTEHHGRIALMARGARRPKSAFRASLEPLYALNIVWRSGRSGMGSLVDIQRGQSLLEPSLALQGLELLAITSRLFQEGDPHGFEETKTALALLAERGQSQGLLASVWYLLDVSGWLGDLSHCWHCGAEVGDAMFWHHAQLVCDGCGKGMRVSVGLRKSIVALMSGQSIRLSGNDVDTWRDMIAMVLREHGIKSTDSFHLHQA